MIKDNIKRILEQMNIAAEKAGRNIDEIKLIAVSKTFPAEKIMEAVKAGLRDFGENYVQDFLSKYDKIKENLNWHFIGHLQTNKIKYIYDKIYLLHTLDSIKLAEKSNNKLEKEGNILKALVQVNIGREMNKHGFFEEELEDFFEKLSNYKNLVITGFMTIPPYFENIEDVRPFYQKMRSLLDEFSKYNNSNNILLKELSMGMSHDFHIAIEEGATMIRIGTAIFGERKGKLKCRYNGISPLNR